MKGHQYLQGETYWSSKCAASEGGTSIFMGRHTVAVWVQAVNGNQYLQLETYLSSMGASRAREPVSLREDILQQYGYRH